MDLSKISEIKLCPISENQSTQLFLGKFNNNDVLIKIKGLINTDFDINKISNLSLVMNNDRFYKYICQNIIPIEIQIIYPVLDEDYRKYFLKRRKVIETPEIYNSMIYPKIINQDLAWIDNIVNGTKEADTILYSDNNIVLLPDLKWSSNKIEDMYYLVIFKNKELKSIRDLNNSHLSLLNDVREICIKKINELHNISSDQLRFYFHYHPSFWQLHLHVTLISSSGYGSGVDIAHLLTTVINNIELVNDYYQRSNIEVYEQIK